MRLRSLLVLTAVCVCFPTALFAQGSITGTVKDTSGAVLPGVTVEASSPVLIEKTRSAVTDGTGQYRIVDLRPGTYGVKFTLAGFKTVDRSGIELTGSFTALVNADLSVGALEETITVSGEAPIVNVQSATREANLSKDIVDSIPTSRMIHTLAVLLPGVTTAGAGTITMMAGSQDVGGDRGGTSMNLAVHGSRGGDMTIRLSGNMFTVGGTATTPINMGGIQEVTVETSGQAIDEPYGGVRTNLIPRDGGNQFGGSFFGSAATEHVESDNFNSDLQAKGLLAPNKIKSSIDANPAFGGPISKDKVWFFTSARYLGLNRYAPGLPFNLNAYLPYNDPRGFIYAPDTTKTLGIPEADSKWFDASARVTWQATPKNKIALAFADQYSDNPNSFSGSMSTSQPLIISPEASLHNHRPYYRYTTVDWTTPQTNKLLIENHLFIWGFDGAFYRDNNPEQDPRVIGVDDSVLGIKYRGWNNGGSTQLGTQRDIRWRTNVNYVTGAHQYQVGVQYSNANSRSHTIGWNNVQYTFANGVPQRVNVEASPVNNWFDKPIDLGLYGGDKWTLGHLTLSGGVRLDYVKFTFPDTPQGPSPLFPTRNVTVPGGPNALWRDVTYRLAAVDDLFGDGKTAVRVSVNKYLVLSGSGLTNPNTFIASTFRAWTDNGANGGIAGDFVPQCDILLPAANGECGALSNPLFGQVTAGTKVDPSLRDGWGKRPYNWEFSTGIQREIMRSVSVDVGYYRRWYGNFTVNTNLAVSPSDYDYFSIVTPNNPGLPNAAQTVSGYVNLKPTSFGRTSSNFVTFADNYGNQIEHYNGVDVNVIARLKQVQVSGGFSTGRVTTDICDVWAARPDLQVDQAGATVGTLNPTQYCRVTPAFTTQVKGFATYTVPVALLQVSAAIQSLPGIQKVVQYTATNADVAASLGRTLTGGATTTVQIVPPGQFFLERLNQIDLRFARPFQLGRTKLTPSVDVFNISNGNAVQQEITAYGSLGRPLVINQARFAKFSLSVNF